MIRVAVIGTGAIGQNHARIYRELSQAHLVGVVDQDMAAATRIATLNGTMAYTTVDDLLAQAHPEAVTVAVPTQAHFPVVKQLLAAGCHVLVEKPIAATLDEAAELIQFAQAQDRVLMVGHVERFNPAIVELKRRLTNGELGKIFQVHARRLGPFPSRVRDVGVIVDLATHDLDIMRYLIGSEVTRVYAETQRHIHTLSEDMFSGLLRFENGTVGVLEINWLTPSKIREIYVTGARGMFVANYLTQDLYFYENADPTYTNWNALSVLRGISEGAMTRFQINRKEPLVAEQEAFLAALDSRESAIARGEDGMAALKLALAFIDSGLSNQPIFLQGAPHD